MSLEEVTDCLKKIFSSAVSNAERNHCFQVFTYLNLTVQVTERYKDSFFKLEDLNFLCSSDQESPVVIFGLNCLEHKVK